MVDIDILSLLYELSDLSFVHCMNSKAVNVCPLYIPIIILHVTVSYSLKSHFEKPIAVHSVILSMILATYFTIVYDKMSLFKILLEYLG